MGLLTICSHESCIKVVIESIVLSKPRQESLPIVTILTFKEHRWVSVYFTVLL
jgi:hypothetical protein